MKKIFDSTNTVENDFVYIASSATTPETALDAMVWETCGEPVSGFDLANEQADFAIRFLRDNWNLAEEMTEEETYEVIASLAESWNLSTSELDYLR